MLYKYADHHLFPNLDISKRIIISHVNLNLSQIRAKCVNSSDFKHIFAKMN